MNAPPVSVAAADLLTPPVPTGAGGAALPADEERRAILAHPEVLHPTLWLGHQLGRHAESAGSGVATGFALLDAQLPGGGWPRRALSELLLPHPGIGEIRLLAPSLVAAQQAGRLVMLFDPPSALSAAALTGLGFDLEELLVIHTRARVIAGTDSLWALEQALKSGHVGAVVAWLPPRLRPERLRRLQLASHAHDGPAFVLRDTDALQRPTSAPLRLGLRSGGADVLAVQVLKRRGPPLETPIRLALQPVLSPQAQGRAARLAAQAAAQEAAQAAAKTAARTAARTAAQAAARTAAQAAAGQWVEGVEAATTQPRGRSAVHPPPQGLASATFVDVGNTRS